MENVKNSLKNTNNPIVQNESQNTNQLTIFYKLDFTHSVPVNYKPFHAFLYVCMQNFSSNIFIIYVRRI